MKLSENQKLIAKSWTREEPFIVSHGSIRSGKTMNLTNAFVDWTLDNVINKDDGSLHANKYYLLAYNYNNVTKVLVSYIEDSLKRFNIKYFNHGTYGSYKINGKVVEFHYFGANNAASFKSIQGSTFRGGFGDEVALLDKEAHDTAIGRCITYPDAKHFMTTNPEGSESHWFYKAYVRPNGSNYAIHVTMHDNPIISEETINTFAKGFSDEMYKRKVLGQWVIATGAVYKMLPKSVDSRELPEFRYILVGNDYGDVDGTTTVYVGYGTDGVYYAFDEIKIKDTNDTIIDKARIQANKLNAIYDKYKVPIFDYNETNPSAIYGIKSNMPTFQQMDANGNPLKDEKGNIVPFIYEEIEISKVNKKKENPRAKSAIQERIDATNTLIAFDKLRFVNGKVPHLEEGMRNAVYGKEGVRLDNGTSDIDILDAFEYAIKKEIPYINDLIYNGGVY